MLALGFEPDRLELHLVKGADFRCELEYLLPTGVPADWPTGTTITLAISPDITWAAVITGSLAVFDKDTTLALVPTDGASVSLTYVNGTSDQVWARGTVKRHD